MNLNELDHEKRMELLSAVTNVLTKLYAGRGFEHRHVQYMHSLNECLIFGLIDYKLARVIKLFHVMIPEGKMPVIITSNVEPTE